MCRQKLFIFLFLFLIYQTSITTAGYTRIWYVKPDQTGDAPTIQAAIDSSAVGDTVLVASGTYAIEGRIWCSKKLILLSEVGPENTLIVGIAERNDLYIQWVSGVIVNGFTFSNFAIIINWGSHNTIENNILDGSGLKLEAGGSHEIRNNLILSSSIGILCVDYSTNVTIHNNTISNCHSTYGWPAGSGICLGEGSYTVYNNIITNNTYGIVSISVAVYLDCNNVWANTDSNYDLTFFPDPTGTNGNISLDPQFCGVDPLESGNFYLQSDSPCAPGNHPDGYSCSVIGKYSVGCGEVPVKKESWGKIKSLYK